MLVKSVPHLTCHEARDQHHCWKQMHHKADCEEIDFKPSAFLAVYEMILVRSIKINSKFLQQAVVLS